MGQPEYVTYMGPVDIYIDPDYNGHYNKVSDTKFDFSQEGAEEYIFERASEYDVYFTVEEENDDE